MPEPLWIVRRLTFEGVSIASWWVHQGNGISSRLHQEQIVKRFSALPTLLDDNDGSKNKKFLPPTTIREIVFGEFSF